MGSVFVEFYKRTTRIEYKQGFQKFRGDGFPDCDEMSFQGKEGCHMKKSILFLSLCLLWVGHVTAGTLILLSGEEFTFDSEKEFVAILLEEFLPTEFVGETGFFLISDSSEDRSKLYTLLARSAELSLTETAQTSVHASISDLLLSDEYVEMVSESGHEYVFAVEVLLKDLDMIYVYRLPSPMNARGTTPEQEPEIIIDATGEGGFEVLEE
jgi:hypothetical protein